MKHVHFIGICGTAMAPIAAMMGRAGWRVTGSDKGIFPPMSEYLNAAGVSYYVGFHPERMKKPDLVVVGNFIGPSNPELAAAQSRDTMCQSYPEVLSQNFIKPESIVVAGTYGKTTMTALLAWIWNTAGKDPSYMSAGILKNFPDGARIGKSDWSIIEGDEYPASRAHPVPKFSYYRPKYLLLTGAQHDHLDVYPREEEYVALFSTLVGSLPAQGLVVAAADRPHIEEILTHAIAPVVRYARKESTTPHDWSLAIHERNKGATVFSIFGPHGESLGALRTMLLGDESLDHFAGAAALAHHCGISPKQIAHALETFQGVRRRLEVRGEETGITVIDEFGHSPSKASAALRAIKLSFPEAHIIAVYEPNIGSRVASAHILYRNAFSLAHKVLVPKLSSTKLKAGDEPRMDGDALARTIKEGNPECEVNHEGDDETLVTHIKKIAVRGDVVVFLGSHGFRGMIEQTLEELKMTNNK